MRIESSNLSYMKVMGNPGRIQSEPAEKNQIDIQENRVKKGEVTREIKTSGLQVNAAAGNEIETSLSKYLSTEEKEMLNGLFPPSGQSFGVNAYRQGQNSGVVAAQRGQQIDLTS